MQVAANGLSFDVEVSGAADAPPVLLVMGLALPAAAWPQSFVDRLLGHGLRVIRFDNRDCGGSSRVPGAHGNALLAIVRALLHLQVDAPYTLADMADDARGILDALEIERAHVVGVSMGGMIAQVLAARSPERVATLTSIMSSSGNRNPRVALGRLRALRAIVPRPARLNDRDAIVEHLMRVFAVIGSPGYRSSKEVLRAQLTPVAERGYDPAGAERQLLAILASADRRAELAQITAPTLVIHGTDDPLVPVAAGIDTARNVGRAQLKIVPGMGHDFAPALQPMLADAVATQVRWESLRPGAERVALPDPASA